MNNPNNLSSSAKETIFIISGPSGCGKSTLIKTLLETYNDFYLSVSSTTREKRNGEEEGKDYFFLEKDQFHEIKVINGFLEDAEVHGNFYGTSKYPIILNLRNKKNILLDIDVQGSAQIKTKENELKKDIPNLQIIRIFLLPESFESLETRLKNRKTDSEETIKKRINAAKEEIKHFGEYDFVLFNADGGQNATFENFCKIVNNNDNLDLFKPSNDNILEKIETLSELKKKNSEYSLPGAFNRAVDFVLGAINYWRPAKNNKESGKF